MLIDDFEEWKRNNPSSRGKEDLISFFSFLKEGDLSGENLAWELYPTQHLLYSVIDRFDDID